MPISAAATAIFFTKPTSDFDRASRIMLTSLVKRDISLPLDVSWKLAISARIKWANIAFCMRLMICSAIDWLTTVWA